MGELLDRIDRLSGERDHLNSQVLKLQGEVATQTQTINELTTQVTALKEQLSKYMGDEDIGKQ